MMAPFEHVVAARRALLATTMRPPRIDKIVAGEDAYDFIRSRYDPRDAIDPSKVKLMGIDVCLSPAMDRSAYALMAWNRATRSYEIVKMVDTTGGRCDEL